MRVKSLELDNARISEPIEATKSLRDSLCFRLIVD